jgi:chaperonin GroES
MTTTTETTIKKLLDDRVLVRVLDAEEKTPGGIVLPDSAQEKPRQGYVLAVGPGRLNLETGERIPMQVDVDDLVLFGQYAGDKTGTELNPNDEIIIREGEVLAVLE